jgi:hypothetical protein
MNACATNTLERTPPFRQSNFSGRNTVGSTSTWGATTEGASSGDSIQVSTPRGGHSSTLFKTTGHDPAIRLPEFKGEALEDPEKHLFIYENIWEAKKITYENTKLAQLAIMIRDRALDWYMSLDAKIPP